MPPDFRDVTPAMGAGRDGYLERGYAVVPRLLDGGEVEAWTARMEAVSGVTRADFARRTPLGLRRRGLVGAWTLPDGVSRTASFWPLIRHEGILAVVRALLGTEARFLQHTDLHVGFSAYGWHRDSVDREHGVGPDWDESREPYRILRVGVYLQSQAESGFRLGVVPGSHRGGVAGRHRLESRRHAWTSALVRALWPSHRAEADADWLDLGSGDCVVFDPRLLHTGSPIDGPKYSFFLAYGVPNGHFQRHRVYYRHRRPDLAYADLAPELVDQLSRAGLYAPETSLDPLLPDAGFQPTRVETLLARSVRFQDSRRS